MNIPQLADVILYGIVIIKKLCCNTWIRPWTIQRVEQGKLNYQIIKTSLYSLFPRVALIDLQSLVSQEQYLLLHLDLSDDRTIR